MSLTHYVKNIELLNSDERRVEHEALISCPCAIQLLKENERMILNFRHGQLRSSLVEEITVVNELTYVLTHNTRYVLSELS